MRDQDNMESQTTTVEPTQTRKFLFDLAFDNGMNRKKAEREAPKPTFTQDHLDEARKLGYEEGFSAGQKAMMEDQQQYLNVLLSQLDQKLSHVMDTSTAIWQRHLAQCQEIALVIARKIVPNYVKTHGLDEIESIVAKIIGEMGREPRLVFRVSEAQFDDANTRINAIAAQAAYAGKLVILGDQDLGPSDCRIEWADGGIERDLKTLWQDIDRVMEEVQTFEDSPQAESVQAAPSNVADATTPSLSPLTDVGDHQ